MIVLMLVLEMVIIGMVISGARDQDLTVRRLETVQSFYAAEAGMNMGIREMMTSTDHDGDGTIGTISNDGDDSNDPILGQARVCVYSRFDSGDTTLISEGRSGEARRRMEATLTGSGGAAGTPGLSAAYFIASGSPSRLSSITWTDPPDETAVVTQMNWPLTSDSTPFWVGGPNNNYGAEFAGTIQIDDAGTWTFYTESDDGSALWIDGYQVVDNDGLHSMSERSGSVSLDAGSHEIMVRFFERSGNHGLIVSWRGPGVPTRTVIPGDVLTH